MYNPHNIPYIGNFVHWKILAKTTIGRCVKFSLSPIFPISKTLHVYFSLCLFLAISGRWRTEQKLNRCEKFPIYGISDNTICLELTILCLIVNYMYVENAISKWH